jgi:hypothetical protein
MGTEQNPFWRREDFQGIAVMLDYPSGLIDTQDQRPHGVVGQERSDL